MATGVEKTADEADISAAAPPPTAGGSTRLLTIAFVAVIAGMMVAWIVFLGWAGLMLLEAILP